MKKNHQDVGKTADSNLCVHCIRQKGIPRINVLSITSHKDLLFCSRTVKEKACFSMELITSKIVNNLH